MRLSNFLFGLSAAALTAAGPLESRAKGTFENASFDDLTVTPGTPTLNVVPSPYKGLVYDGFNAQSSKLNLAGLKPHSSPNSIFFDINTAITDGNTAQFSAKKGYFYLWSMYAGCSVNTGAALVPTECTVIASSLTKDGERKSTTFKLQADKKMQLVEFPAAAFSTAKQVSFVVTGQTVDDAAITASFDNLKYTLYE